MGRLLHHIDFNQASMSRKVFAYNSYYGGLETPRNSFELPLEAFQSFCAGGDNLLCSYQLTSDWSENNYYSTEAPMKELINEEISKGSKPRNNAPSVVARLMGVDMLPMDTKPSSQEVEKKGQMPDSNSTRSEWSRTDSVNHALFSSNFASRRRSRSFDHRTAGDYERTSGLKLNKPKPREHPQEEELQKFKKEFEAWQAARFKECSQVVELGCSPSQWLAQENLNREKMVLYANSMRKTESEKLMGIKGQIVTEDSLENSHLQPPKNKNEVSLTEQRKPSCLKDSTDLKMSSLENSNKRFDVNTEPTKIVILRPGPDKIVCNEESWSSSPGTTEERGSIEDFLEEVKEKLKRELQGKISKRSTTVRGGGIETPFSERSPDPKHIAQCIAKQARENVTRDFGMNLVRSESARSYRSEIHFDGTDSPEFIKRDTRNFLAERLRNVLKEETAENVPTVARESSRLSMLRYDKSRAEQSGDIFDRESKLAYWESVKNEPDMQSRSFRQEPDDEIIIQQELSPRNLVRSLSAPVSGTSFGKLLLEDRHILTGAQIRRKHEAPEKATAKMKKRKKEKFNLREKVSSFKYSFTFRGVLFGRKIQSLKHSHGSRHDFTKDILNGPTVMMNFYDRHENPTEVPPSPASVCSSTNDEFWRAADYFSPSPISDVPTLDDSEIPNVFREISSNLNDLRRQINQLENDGSIGTVTDDQAIEDETVEIKDRDEAYIRDLLVASGFYDDSSDKFLSRWDPLGKPISNQVFLEVEESYQQKEKDDEGSTKDLVDKLNHKLLFDLLNEALLGVLGQPMTMSKFMKKAVGSVLEPPNGRKLLDRIWETIRIHVYPLTERSYYSLDNMVGRDLRTTPWSELIDDDTKALGKDTECQIIGDLIEELVKDLQS